MATTQSKSRFEATSKEVFIYLYGYCRKTAG